MNFNQKFLYIMTLTLSIISIVYFYNISEIDAQANRTQALTIQLEPGVVEFQPPVNINTGQTIKLPGTLIGVKDPITGQIIARDVKFISPEVTGPSVTGTLDANGLFSRNDAPESAFANDLALDQ